MPQHRTLTALFQNRPDANRAAEALKAAGFDGAEIHERDATEDAPPENEYRDVHAHDHDHAAQDHDHGHDHGGGLMDRIRSMFGGHHDAHAYGEGLRRGHVLLTLKVEDSRETRAAEILEASQSVDLDSAQRAWRADGWTGGPAFPGADYPDTIGAPGATTPGGGPGWAVDRRAEETDDETMVTDAFDREAYESPMPTAPGRSTSAPPGSPQAGLRYRSYGL